MMSRSVDLMVIDTKLLDQSLPSPWRPWDVLVVDEGHQIKNPSSQSGRVLRRINARSRILLTGPDS